MNRKLFAILNTLGTILLLGILILTYLYSEYLKFFHLDFGISQLLIFSIISFLLFLAVFQETLSIFFRVFCGIASILVLIEAMLMNIWVLY